MLAACCSLRLEEVGRGQVGVDVYQGGLEKVNIFDTDPNLLQGPVSDYVLLYEPGHANLLAYARTL